MQLKMVLAGVLLWPALVHADAIARLDQFFQNTTGMKAGFRQVVLDNQGRTVQDVTGEMRLQRPGKFRWDYRKPYQQEVVGDGKKVWLYDPDLAQVTVRDLDKVLGSSPAALLAGNKDIRKIFALRNADTQGKQEWVEVIPKENDSGFDKIMLGFEGEQLKAMKMFDSFGQQTVIEFSAIERNPKLDPAAFKFTPPAGVDVLSE